MYTYVYIYIYVYICISRSIYRSIYRSPNKKMFFECQEMEMDMSRIGIFLELTTCPLQTIAVPKRLPLAEMEQLASRRPKI